MQRNENIPDSTLISAIGKGDHYSFGQLFHKYGTTLYSFVFSILKDEKESEEVVQNIFLKIWEKRKSLHPESSFKSYLFTIALNDTRKVYRKKLQDTKYKQEIAIELGTNPSSDLSMIEYKNLIDYVDAIIDRLPPVRREIFIRSKKDGLKNAEIAKLMNISEQTVKNQLVTAQKFLLAEAKKDKNELGFLLISLFYKL